MFDIAEEAVVWEAWLANVNGRGVGQDGREFTVECSPPQQAIDHVLPGQLEVDCLRGRTSAASS